ncbi:pyruvate kinase [Galactobacillus timonensis]|jgi:pyruvate kinase|uniref:pyruvate kinase n=2 Tax=Galactobacillus timonensis TaxID=2041840 RepID=UPI001FD98FEE|nr:pyruvate kinase [Galactobacillus timonensis]MDD6369253.1 pyruvate kinase [Galactobacillus timonensis]MDY6283489.1 pyruvate kinase [Erysipelotrichaceae bacterium]
MTAELMNRNHLFKKTKVICTIGPATDNEEMITKLAEAGMNIARLNFSHGTHEEHEKRIKMIRKVSEETGITLAICLDTKGPEIRLGSFKNDTEEYQKGEIVYLEKADIEGTHERFHIQCPELFDDLHANNSILINDGKMRLTVLENDGQEMKCRVEVSGPISSHKGCNVPGVRLSMPFLSEKDISDLRFGCRNDVDFISASFVRRAADVNAIRKILIEEGKPKINIIAKIENQEGYDNVESILEAADGVMVARGDLGVEIPTQLVPVYQKHIIAVANRMGKPVVTATHMLDSMTHNPRCTRAEASDVCNAVLDGTDCVMLSAETASGEYPIESCEMMSEIAEEAEKILPYRDILEKSKQSGNRTIQDAVGIAISDASQTLDNVGAVVVFTQGGTTARRISKFRPCVPILAITFTHDTQRKLLDWWGVTPIFSDVQNTMTNDDDLACLFAKEYGVKPGQLIILSAGYPTGEGSANMMKIIQVK